MIPKSAVSGIVIYGSGRHFSSGADLDDLIGTVKSQTSPGSPGPVDESPILINNLRAFRFFQELNVPVIAAIRGVCLGSALELALFCHGRICGDGSVMGLPESSFGLIPGCGGIQQMNILAGLPRTMELVLTGNSFTAEEAMDWKIVDKIVQKKDVVTAAIQLIRVISPGYNRAQINSYIYKHL